MFFILSQVWDKVKTVSSHEELNLRPLDCAVWCSTTEPRKLYGEQGLICRFSQPSKRSSHFFFLLVPRAQHLASARTRTRIVQLRAQCTDHWTTGQSCSIGMPAVQLITHVKSSTLYYWSYSHKSNFFQLDGLLLPFCIIKGLHSVSSAILKFMWHKTSFSISLQRPKLTYSISKHDTIDIADPSNIQDPCHMNCVVGLAHYGGSVVKH